MQLTTCMVSCQVFIAKNLNFIQFFVLCTQFYMNEVLSFPCECFMCVTFLILILIVNFVTHDKQPPNKDLCLIRCLVLTSLNSFPLGLTSPPNVKGSCIWVMFGWQIKSISIQPKLSLVMTSLRHEVPKLQQHGINHHSPLNK